MEIKQLILDSIKWTVNTLGWTLISDDWGNANDKCTCAMGCVLLKDNPQDVVIIEEERENASKVAELLGVSELWVDSFINGFDGNRTFESSKLPEAWAMGAELAKETKPITHFNFLEAKMEEDYDE